MAYAQVSYGSQGSDVKTLQEMLNQNGYELKVDGIFGNQTKSAVRDYQSKNGLAVDGIAGNQTWGALTSAASTGQTGATDTTDTTAASTPAVEPKPTYEFAPYKESDTVKQAEALLQQQLANKPGEYSSPWQSQLGGVIDQIMNRNDFSYDLNGDALYQQYKDNYINQGKQAMMDAMGQAAALTGGYGNSYGQAVGQQAYQAQLQNLNNVIPELYQMALDRYTQEGQELYDQFSMLGAMEEQDYGRYRDTVSDYYNQLADMRDQYYSERDYDYSKYIDERDYDYSKYADERDFTYQTERDKKADEQWQAEYDEAIRQFNVANDVSSSSSSGSSSGSSGGSYSSGSSSSSSSSSSKVTYDTHGYTTAQIKALQKAAGITADGIWGAQTEAAYKAGYRPGSTNTEAAKTAATATYTTGELIEAAAAGYSYSEIEAILKKRGVNTSSAAVKADIKYALSR